MQCTVSPPLVMRPPVSSVDQIAFHPRLQHGFGVDTTEFHPVQPPHNRTWDVMFVGAFLPYKRPWLLLEHPGRRKLAIGRIDMLPDLPAFVEQAATIVQHLQTAGVTVRPPVPFHELNALYNAAHTVLVPATVDGGGERAVLEARAAGALVQVAPDNPKLQVCIADGVSQARLLPCHRHLLSTRSLWTDPFPLTLTTHTTSPPLLRKRSLRGAAPRRL